MKETELRQHAICSACERKIGADGLPLFWTVRVERHVLKLDAIQRQTGLTMMLAGNAAIARAMGPHEEMTEVVLSETLTLCEACVLSAPTPIGELVLRRAEEKDGGDG